MAMQPHACRTCGTNVEVEKFSYHHTSIQWQPDAEETCAEFLALAAAGNRQVDASSCKAMRESIDAAVLDGTIVVPD